MMMIGKEEIWLSPSFCFAIPDHVLCINKFVLWRKGGYYENNTMVSNSVHSRYSIINKFVLGRTRGFG